MVSSEHGHEPSGCDYLDRDCVVHYVIFCGQSILYYTKPVMPSFLSKHLMQCPLSQNLLTWKKFTPGRPIQYYKYSQNNGTFNYIPPKCQQIRPIRIVSFTQQIALDVRYSTHNFIHRIRCRGQDEALRVGVLRLYCCSPTREQRFIFTTQRSAVKYVML